MTTNTSSAPGHFLRDVDAAVSAVAEAPWIEASLCSQSDPAAFFPEKGGSTIEAKQICSNCEVRAECLDWALEHDERHGIWGGLSERERRRLKKTMTRDAAASASPTQIHQEGAAA